MSTNTRQYANYSTASNLSLQTTYVFQKLTLFFCAWLSFHDLWSHELHSLVATINGQLSYQIVNQLSYTWLSFDNIWPREYFENFQRGDRVYIATLNSYRDLYFSKIFTRGIEQQEGQELGSWTYLRGPGSLLPFPTLTHKQKLVLVQIHTVTTQQDKGG